MQNPRFKTQWMEAFKKEYDNLVGMNAFVPVKRCDIPDGHKIIPVRNIFELKFTADGVFRKFKVRQAANI